MPGTIHVSVVGLLDVQTSSSVASIKVAMGNLQYLTSDLGDHIFSVTRLRENLIVTLLDVNGTQILSKGRDRDQNDNREWLLGRETFIQWLWNCPLENARQSALRKKHEELINGSSFTKSKSIASDLSSLSPMQTRDIVAVANRETNPGLSQETELKNNADRDPVSFNLITWKPEVKDTLEKTKIQLSSSNVSSSKKLPEVKNLDTVPLVKQETRDLSKIPKRKSMRRSMSETNLNTVLKMISTFEVKVTQDTKIRTAKIQTGSCIDREQKTKAQSQVKKAVNCEKPEERNVISIEDMEKSVRKINKERCDDLVIVPRDESTVVVEEKSLEQSTRRSDSLSKQTRIRNSVVEVRDDEKKPNKSVRLKASQFENARGSRLWIFPDEAKDLSQENDFKTRDMDLEDANLIQKKTEESRRVVETVIRCRSIAKMKNNKWNNIERSKTHKSENSADSDGSRGPVGQVMRALIVVGFAGLVFMTRQRS